MIRMPKIVMAKIRDVAAARVFQSIVVWPILIAAIFEEVIPTNPVVNEG